MRFEIEGDTVVVASFLEAEGYPYPWRPEAMVGKVLMLRVMTDKDELAGCVWLVWDHIMPLTLEFHACMKKQYRGRWITPELYADFEFIGRLFGARALLTRTPGDREGRLVGALFTRRFGYKQIEPGLIYKRID